MATSRFIDHIRRGSHASLPNAASVAQGTLYACTDHNKIYQSDTIVWDDWFSVVGGGGSVTSNELSNEASIRAAADSVISIAISVASAAATSADAHANAASAAATSVDGRIASLSAINASLSARSMGDVSIHGLQSIINAISNQVSVEKSIRAASVQTASAAATSVDARVNALSDLHSVLSTRFTSASAQFTSIDAKASIISDRITSISTQLVSLEVHASTASAAATSADTHAATASAAATSVDGRVASLSAVFASLSARSVGDVSTHGFQSMFNALSNRISAIVAGAASVTSAEHLSVVNRLDNVSLVLDSPNPVSVVGLQSVVLAIQSEFDVVSTRINPLSSKLTSISAAFTSVNQKISVVSSQVTSINAFLQAGSARSVGDVSTHGYQSVIDALSNRIAGIATSVTSAEHLSVDNRVSIVSSRLANWFNASVLDATGASVQASVASTQAVFDAISDRVSAKVASVLSTVNGIGNRLDLGFSAVLSSGFSVVGLQSAIDALSERAATGTSMALDAQTRVNTICARLSSVSALDSAAVSVEGLQGVINALSGRIGGAVASVTSAEHISTDTRVTSINAVLASISATTSTGSVRGVQSAINALSWHVSVASAAATSVDVRVTSASAAFAGADTSLDNRITSASAAVAGALTSLDNRIASVSVDRASTTSLVLAGGGQFHVVTGAQAIATATFTKVSGLSVSVAGSGIYEIHGQLVWTQSGAGSASAIFNMGMSMTAQPTYAMFRLMGNAGAPGAASGLQNPVFYTGASVISATPSIMYSVKANPGASGSIANTMFFDGVLQASTAQSQLKVVVATSSGAFGVQIQVGSWIRAYRLQ